MKVELTPDTAQLVQDEIADGRASSVEEALRCAINAAKLTRLREELAEAEEEGRAFSSDEVRLFMSR